MKNQIWGIILASGMSTRMGAPKTLLKYKNKTIIEHVITTAKQSRLDYVAVVINDDVDGLYSLVKLAGADKIIKNQQPHLGMSSSLQMGIRALPEPVEAAVILLADQPEMTSDEIDAVLKSFQDNKKPLIIQCSYWHREKGHPVLFHRKLFPDLLKISGDQGGKSVIKQYKEKVVYAEIDKKSIPDIDEYHDYISLITKEEVLNCKK